MTRSNKKAIVKDNPSKKELFRRRIRRKQNQETQQSKYFGDTDEFSLTSDKSIVNDYDYCDYILDYENNRGFVKRLSHYCGQTAKDFFKQITTKINKKRKRKCFI